MKTLHVAAVAALFSGSVAHAEWTPAGPIKVLIAFKAGGGSDTMARMIIEDVQAERGWNLIPENVPGAGGGVMARELKNAPADGLTIGFGITDTFAYGILAARNPGYSSDDFDFLATLAGTQMAVVAKAERGWTTFSDVIEAARAGEEISFGTMTPRLADGAYYLGKVNDVDFNIVTNYNGGQDVLNAINAEDVDIGWVAGPQKSGVLSGDLIDLVNGEDVPLIASPNAQELSDIGVDFHFGATFLAVAPAGLDEEIATALTDAITTAVQKEGSKANTFINKLFVEKIKAGADARAYVEREAADAEALLSATAD